MSIDFREAAPDDRERILELRRVAFPDEDVEKQEPAFWQWEFRDGYAGPARIFVAVERERVVGHFAFVPQQYRVSGSDVRGALAVDVMTHPDWRGRGVFRRLGAFAVEGLRREFAFITAFQIREAVLPGMLANGWREHSAHRILLRPLSLRNLVARRSVQPHTGVSSATAEEVQSLNDAAEIDALSWYQPRSEAFVRWRYLQHPQRPYRIAGAARHGRLAAYVVHRDATLRGFDTLAVCDVGCLADEGGTLRTLLRSVMRDARARGAQLVASLVGTSHPLRRVLLSLGIVPGPHRFRLLLQNFDPALESSLRGPFAFTWGDTDHL